MKVLADWLNGSPEDVGPVRPDLLASCLGEIVSFSPKFVWESRSNLGAVWLEMDANLSQRLVDELHLSQEEALSIERAFVEKASPSLAQIVARVKKSEDDPDEAVMLNEPEPVHSLIDVSGL